MRKTVTVVVVLILLFGGLLLLLVNRERISFYVNLLKAYQLGQRFFQGYEHLARDIPFNPQKEVRLDVYSPAEGSGHPVLFFVHGGGWKDYDKKLFAPVAQKLLPAGMVVVIPDYTLYPGAGYEQMADEVAAALSWTLDHIQEYGGDPQRVVVAGHSAGGHLGGLAVMDPRYLAAYGHQGSQVCGLIGMSGVYNVQAEYDHWLQRGTTPEVILGVMGGLENFERASPIHYVRPDLPAVLVLHGAQDETVPVSIGIEFEQALRAAGAPVELRIYEDAGHSDYLFAALTADDSPLVQDIVGFVRRCTG
ncbi:MAG: alpha/beta hydrolase [Anaerolineae bacterium]|jgi:acetyl esterase/lipase